LDHVPVRIRPCVKVSDTRVKNTSPISFGPLSLPDPSSSGTRPQGSRIIPLCVVHAVDIMYREPLSTVEVTAVKWPSRIASCPQVSSEAGTISPECSLSNSITNCISQPTVSDIVVTRSTTAVVVWRRILASGITPGVLLVAGKCRATIQIGAAGGHETPWL